MGTSPSVKDSRKHRPKRPSRDNGAIASGPTGGSLSAFDQIVRCSIHQNQPNTYVHTMLGPTVVSRQYRQSHVQQIWTVEYAKGRFPFRWHLISLKEDYLYE